MITESPVEVAARKHCLSIGSQREQRMESLTMRYSVGSYSWAVRDVLNAARRAIEPERAWCPFYGEFVDNLPEDA